MDEWMDYLIGILQIGHDQGASELNIEGPQDTVEHFAHVRIVGRHTDTARRVFRQHLAQIGLLNPHGASGREDAHRARHRWLSFLLLQTVGDDQEGP